MGQNFIKYYKKRNVTTFFADITYISSNFLYIGGVVPGKPGAVPGGPAGALQEQDLPGTVENYVRLSPFLLTAWRPLKLFFEKYFQIIKPGSFLQSIS